MKLKKILSLGLVGILTTSLLTACSSSSQGEEQGVLNLYNIGDYINPDLIDEFTEETGIKVIYESYDTNEAMYQKLKSGTNNYDLVFPSDYMVEKLISEEMIQKIDKEKLTNYEQIGEDFKNPSYDKNEEYSIPYLWGTFGIMYNTSIVTETVDSWDMLWNEKYSGQIMMLDSMRDSIGIALKKLGYSMNSTNPDEINLAMEELKKQKPLILSYANDEGMDRLIGEDAAMGIAYSGDAVVMMESNPNLAYAIPKEGTNKWVDTMCIPTQAENIEEAYAFIDFLLRPESAKSNADYIGYAIPNSGGYEMLDEEQQNNPIMYPSKEDLDKTETFKNITNEELRLYDDAWTEIKSY